MRSTTSRGRSRRSTAPPAIDRFDVIHDHCGFTALGDGRPHRHAARAHAARAVHRRHRGVLRPPRVTRRRSSGSAGAQLASAPPELGPCGGDPEPDRPAALAAARAQGRLPALDRPDDAGEGAAPRDRGGPRRRRAARARRRHPARAAGVLRPRGRAAHRRRARPLRRRDRRSAQALAVRAARARC